MLKFRLYGNFFKLLLKEFIYKIVSKIKWILLLMVCDFMIMIRYINSDNFVLEFGDIIFKDFIGIGD